MRALLARALRCPGCDAELSPRGLNEPLQIASCGRCGRVLDLALPRRADAAHAAAPAPALVPRLSVPPQLAAFEEAGCVTLTWTHAGAERTRPVVNLTLGACFGGYVAVVAASSRCGAAAMLGALAVGWAYAAAAVWFDRVQLVASREALEVRVGPLPWFGGRRLERSAVRQLFIEARQVPTRDGRPESSSFVLSAVVGEEVRRVELVRDIPERAQAEWMAQSLERALGLEHAPVGGELAPG